MANSNVKNLSYGIVGVGRFGGALARELAASGAEIIVMDKDEEVIKEFREITENALVVPNLDRKSLEETGIQNCDVAIVCIAERIDVSILTTLNLISMGIPHVIAKAASADHGEILKKLGAEIVYPERDMAHRLAHRLEHTKVLDFVQLSEKILISKLVIPEKFIGKAVREAGMRSSFGLNIIAIESGDEIIKAVSPDYVFKKDDIVYVAGEKEGLDRFTAAK